VQSPALAQPRPGAHFAAHVPPQSTSVSAAFWTPSEQVGGAQWAVWSHTRETQSSSASQLAWSPHGAHEPPQSTSVSSPSTLPSPQVAA
jgi:hypothetical protein